KYTCAAARASFFERRGFAVLTQQSVEKRRQALTNFQMEKLLSLAALRPFAGGNSHSAKNRSLMFTS
ncbi:MAG: hypothetical protein J7516_18005, partial [Shinella sp.]|nr:hypothetical protein [Shinella sp.]